MNIKNFPQITKHVGFACEANETNDILINSDDFEHGIPVAFSLPGEKIAFDKLKYKRATYYTFDEVLDNHNPERVKAPCPHFTICGGCVFQHMSTEFYKTHKTKNLYNILHNWSNEIEDLIVIPSGLRRKANFEGIKKEDKIYLGFHRHNSRQIINLDTCKILRPEIVELMPQLKILLLEILDNFEKAEFFITLTENGLDVGLEIQKVKFLPETKREIIAKFGGENKLTRFIFRHGNKLDTIYQDQNKKAPFLKFADFEVNITPWAFMQTSPEAESEMIKIIKSMVSNLGGEINAADLFCGRGTYALSLINNFSKITAVELAGDSIDELARIAKLYNLPIETQKRDLFLDPLNEIELNEFDLVIINPPRAGASSQIEKLVESGVQNIIYVSCNPHSFARDAEILSKNYKLIKIQPIDQFIWSNHLEVIGHFERLV